MNRRTFNKLTGIAAVAAITGRAQGEQRPEDWKSGKDSPVHDADRLVPVSGRTMTLEDEFVRISFDDRSGAIVEFFSKRTGWDVQKSAKLGESFRVFAPMPDRSFNPVLGARNPVSSIRKAEDGRSLSIVWMKLRSEYGGTLAITLTATVVLDQGSVSFDMTAQNDSPLHVASVEWPILGALTKPKKSATLRRIGFTIGSYNHDYPLDPRFPTDINACGINFPTQSSEGRYSLVLAEDEGLYIGTHDTSAKEMIKYQFELKPGYVSSRFTTVPQVESIGGHPVRITYSTQHLSFVLPGETYSLPRVVMSPFAGSWHRGVDVYRRWWDSWYKRPPSPEWLDEPHSWQQIQLNSSEDDLRTAYRDLPMRVAQAARAGVRAVQVTGWNNLGQDRNNPSHDTDPRLGTHQEFKDAIARIQKMGVRVILFNKYTWADTSTDWYKSELNRYMATDPNGIVSWFHGFKYQTPEQLADINTRRFSVACLNCDKFLQICVKEFQKSIDLNADGILYDEVMQHGGANYCFAKDHGHRSPASLWAGDLRLGAMFRDQIRKTKGEREFLMAGEGPYDLETQHYSLSYTRMGDTHTPLARYADPYAAILVAILGFDERETINSCLQYRYLMSFEAFNFKGNIEDFPLSVTYGQKMEALRLRYRNFLWDGEFRDAQEATVSVEGRPYEKFSVFVRKDRKRAAVVVNEGSRPLTAKVKFDGGTAKLAWANPEEPELHVTDGTVEIPARSVIVVMEG
jgi:Domain of unknown function (DUF6259)